MKRFATFLLALVMILSLAIPAFAEGENNTITINNAKSGETYAIYKMFDLESIDNSTEPATYTYKVNASWAAFFAEGGTGAQYITKNPAGAVTAISDAAALAKAAATWTGKPKATEETKAVSATVAFENLADGYWLITSTLGTKAMAYTTPVNPTVEITEKNEEPTIEKFVQEDSTGNWGKENDAQIGDTVNFKSTVKIVKGARNVVVHDFMDAGFTLIADSISIEGLTKGTDYTVLTKDEIKNTWNFEITFNQDWIDAYDFGEAGSEEFDITYSATLNWYPVSMGNPSSTKNKTYVSYGQDSESEEDETVTKTHKFTVNKYATGIENLAGAVFELRKNGEVVKLYRLGNSNIYTVEQGHEKSEPDMIVESFTTIDSADIIILGVDSDDDYTLVEIQAPVGYNMLTEAVPVVWTEENEEGNPVDINNTVIDIENKSGTELPSTGGVGTTMFYIFGGILVLAAVVLLVTKKRMATAE